MITEGLAGCLAREPGAIFHIPPRKRHAFRCEPGEPVLAVQSYTPAGEEQRFLKLAGKQARPAGDSTTTSSEASFIGLKDNPR